MSLDATTRLSAAMLALKLFHVNALELCVNQLGLVELKFSKYFPIFAFVPRLRTYALPRSLVPETRGVRGVLSPRLSKVYLRERIASAS